MDSELEHSNTCFNIQNILLSTNVHGFSILKNRVFVLETKPDVRDTQRGTKNEWLHSECSAGMNFYEAVVDRRNIPFITLFQRLGYVELTNVLSWKHHLTKWQHKFEQNANYSNANNRTCELVSPNSKTRIHIRKQSTKIIRRT